MTRVGMPALEGSRAISVVMKTQAQVYRTDSYNITNISLIQTYYVETKSPDTCTGSRNVSPLSKDPKSTKNGLHDGHPAPEILMVLRCCQFDVM